MCDKMETRDIPKISSEVSGKRRNGSRIHQGMSSCLTKNDTIMTLTSSFSFIPLSTLTVFSESCIIKSNIVKAIEIEDNDSMINKDILGGYVFKSDIAHAMDTSNYCEAPAKYFLLIVII